MPLSFLPSATTSLQRGTWVAFKGVVPLPESHVLLLRLSDIHDVHNKVRWGGDNILSKVNVI